MKKIQNIIPIILYFSLVTSTYSSSSDQQQTSKSFSSWLTWPTISIVTLAVATPILGVKCWLNYRELDNAKYRTKKATDAIEKVDQHKEALTEIIRKNQNRQQAEPFMDALQSCCLQFMPENEAMAENTAFHSLFKECHSNNQPQRFRETFDQSPLKSHIQNAQNDHRDYSRAAWAYGTCATLSALGIGGIALGRVKGWIKP